MSKIIGYEDLKEYYEEFKKNPPKDSFEAGVEELNHLRNLIKFASSQKLNDDVAKYQEREKVVRAELEKE